MGIKFRCPACEKKLHVKAFLAGKRGVCPKCGAKVRIPLAGDASSSTLVAGRDARREAAAVPAHHAAGRPHSHVSVPVAQEFAYASHTGSAVRHASTSTGTGNASIRDPIGEAPEAVWYVRPPTGGQFGPADGTIMRRWLNEGRVGADALVWREGWTEWKLAGLAFPSLEAPVSLESCAAPLAGDAMVGDFVLEEEHRAGGRPLTRGVAKARGRYVSLIVGLLLVCAALVVALMLVLRSRG